MNTFVTQHASLLAFAAVAATACGGDGHFSSLSPGPGIVVTGNGGGGGGPPIPTVTLAPNEGAKVASPCRWLGPGAAKDLAYSPDGKLIGTASGGLLELYEAATGKQQRTTPWEQDSVGSFSIAGDLVAIGTSAFRGNGDVAVYRLADMSVVKRIPLARAVPSVAFSPDGKWLAAATSSDVAPGKTLIEVWNTSDFSLATEIDIGNSSLDAVGFTPDGSTLVGASEAMGGWSTGSWQSTAALGGGYSWSALRSSRIVFSNAGKVARVSGYTSAAAAPPNGMAIDFQSPETADVKVAIISHDGTLLAAGDEKGRVFLWEISAARPLLFRFAAQSGSINALAFSPDDSALSATSDDGSLYSWRVRDGKELWHSGAGVFAGAVVGASRDGSKVVVQSQGSYADLSADDGSLLGKFPLGEGSCVTDANAARLACSNGTGPNYTTLNGVPITAGIDPMAPDLVSKGPVALMPDATTLAQVVTLRRGPELPLSTAVRLWDVNAATFKDLPADAALSALAVSGDGALVAASRGGGVIGVVWDVAKANAIVNVGVGDLDFNATDSVVLSPDGKWAAFAHYFLDRIVLTDLPGGAVHAFTVAGITGFDHLVASPSGKFLFAEMDTIAAGGITTANGIVIDLAVGTIVKMIPGASKGAAFLSEKTLIRGEPDGSTTVWCLG
jgi:WD40 repeat protein